jgi:hypothetical protein
MINQLRTLDKWRYNNHSILRNVLVPVDGLMAPEKTTEVFSLEEVRAIQRCDYVFAGNEYIYHMLNRHIYDNSAPVSRKLGVGSKSQQSQTLLHYGFPLGEYSSEVSNLGYRPYANR